MKCIFNFRIVFGINLHPLQAIFFSEFPSLSRRDLSLLLKIIFIAYEQNFYLLAAVIFDFFDPILEMLKAFLPFLSKELLSNIINQESTNSTSVVWSGDRSEILLAGSIPYLQFNGFVGEWDEGGSKLYSKCHLMIVAHFLLHKLGDDATFAYSFMGEGIPVSPITMNLNR